MILSLDVKGGVIACFHKSGLFGLWKNIFESGGLYTFKSFVSRKSAVPADWVNKVVQCLDFGTETPCKIEFISFCILTIVHLCSRADHVKENGLTYPSPGISNGIKLSPQETRPSSPAALPVAGEKVRDLLVLKYRDVTPGRTKKKLAKLRSAGMLLSVVSLAWKIQ